ncbi:ComEA family DNA-binding protein [Vibrio sp. RE86]|nr:ComEA family DNA-binding protein [Vibrio sp. RE86]
MLKQLMMVFALALFASMAMASDVTPNPKYEGIDITVNINQASAQELADLLIGIGLKKAQAIVEYRDTHGKFETANDMVLVKGIGVSTVAKNLERIEL